MADEPERLSLAAQKAVDHYLNKRLVPAGILGALLGGLVTWAVQQNANSAAKEAVATGLQTMTAKVVETSTDLHTLKMLSGEAAKQSDSAKETANTAAATATTAAAKAQKALADLEESAKQATLTRAQATEAQALVKRVFQDAQSVEELTRLLKEHRKSAQEQVIEELRKLGRGSVDALLTPPGTIVAWPGEWPGSAAQNELWHLCDGSALRREDYPQLSAALGGIYGSVGNDFVKLPDFRGYFLRGAGAGSEALGNLQPDAVGPHEHAINLGPYRVASYDTGGDTDTDPHGARPHEIRVSGATAVNVSPGETRPRNYAVNWVIRIR